jgi:serine/threonine protein phosphatase PrpC
MDDLMPIGEFAERSGLSPKRLRSYAAAGLLVPAAVDAESGYRYYAPGQLREAHAIDALRRADVPLAEIGSLLRDPSPENLDEWTRQVDLATAERHEALQQARHLLEVDEGPTRASPVDDVRKERYMILTATTRTDIGRVRERNEDRAVCLDRLVAIADGMGGPPGGDTASSLAIAVVAAAFSGRSLDELEAAARAANAAVFERASADEQLEGMGTTLCAVGMTDDGQLAVINIGDSRAYLLRGGSLQRLTADHTLVAELVRQGELSQDAVVDHPQRGVLTRAVGAGPTVEVDVARHPAHPGDRLLLCSDGLSNEIGADLILSLIESEQDLSTATDALVDHALTNGGRDNITVVVADVSA